jgi:hypothetical protein
VKIHISCKREFRHKHAAIWIIASSAIFESVNKMCLTRSFLDQKYIRMLCHPRYRFDEIGATLKYLPRKSLKWLVQRLQVSFKTASIATKILRLLPNKIREKQTIKNDLKRTHFCKSFCGEHYMTVFLSQKLTSFFSLMKFCSIWLDIAMLRAIVIATVLIRERILKCRFPIRRLICGMLLLPVK